MPTEEEFSEYQRLMKARPHVVILGAGATVATIPGGDKNGRKSSVMDGFLARLGMLEVIKDAHLVTQSGNLEDIYSELHEREEYEPIRTLLDQRIREYFLELEIPDQPTIYDLILLSLRKKDLVATFNWDPLLLQAYQRVARITKELPRLAFLHGNVLVGYCRDHKVGGIIYARCPQCGKHFAPGRLLYPIRHKDYAADPYTEDHWKTIRSALKRAYLVTIFGYSAPKTDSEAITLMKEAWGESYGRALEDFEFIDIRPEDELVASWSEFIHSHHYQVQSNFFDSSLAKFPRRSTVELFDRTMECKFTNPTTPFTPKMSWAELELVVNSLLHEEQQLGTKDFLCVVAA